MPAPEDVHILPFGEVGVNQQRERVAAASPPRKKSRLSYGRKPHNESHWWLEHLTPAIREQYLADPHGRLSLKFRRLFRVPFVMFLDLVEMANQRWWCDWTPNKIDAAGRIVSSLELKILGALFLL